MGKSHFFAVSGLIPQTAGHRGMCLTVKHYGKSADSELLFRLDVDQEALLILCGLWIDISLSVKSTCQSTVSNSTIPYAYCLDRKICVQ